MSALLVAGTRQEADCYPRWIVGFSEKCCSSPDPLAPSANTCCHGNISPLLLSHGFICFKRIEFPHKMAICLPNWVQSSEHWQRALLQIVSSEAFFALFAQCKVNTLALSPLSFHSSPSPPSLYVVELLQTKVHPGCPDVLQKI